MSAREAFLAQEDPTGDNVESLIKKHEDFDKAIASQQEKLNNLEQLARQLVSNYLEINFIHFWNKRVGELFGICLDF